MRHWIFVVAMCLVPIVAAALAKQWYWVGLLMTVAVALGVWELAAVKFTGHTLSQMFGNAVADSRAVLLTGIGVFFAMLVGHLTAMRKGDKET